MTQLSSYNLKPGKFEWSHFRSGPYNPWHFVYLNVVYQAPFSKLNEQSNTVFPQIYFLPVQLYEKLEHT